MAKFTLICFSNCVHDIEFSCHFWLYFGPSFILTFNMFFCFVLHYMFFKFSFHFSLIVHVSFVFIIISNFYLYLLYKNFSLSALGHHTLIQVDQMAWQATIRSALLFWTVSWIPPTLGRTETVCSLMDRLIIFLSSLKTTLKSKNELQTLLKAPLFLYKEVLIHESIWEYFLFLFWAFEWHFRKSIVHKVQGNLLYLLNMICGDFVAQHLPQTT